MHRAQRFVEDNDVDQHTQAVLSRLTPPQSARGPLLPANGQDDSQFHTEPIPRHLPPPPENHPPDQVLVNVYEITASDVLERINKVTATEKWLIGGAFHVGVEVYGREWSYGWGKGPGVACSMPRVHRKHRFRCTVPMERTPLSDGDVADIIGNLVELWPGEEYDWLHRNCCTFANAFTEALGVGRIPAWIDRFARGASAATSGARTVLNAAATPGRLLAPVLRGCSGPALTRSLINAKESDHPPLGPPVAAVPSVQAISWDSAPAPKLPAKRAGCTRL
eukprot:gnl/MRDRNA2_/MRDRNA2_121123_c0_seq1.p1 gnl/MRDRNA2_/MRDRNA2_121123_c0~~gnl/MRDRNA2_/MRDRNA2_121123_c0_seq1.p1  ORF type:complete len:279 (+),score=47.89 gnl/MRDRNA2_/MRDRNA2_121123_c0_seq1:97-933(+)